MKFRAWDKENKRWMTPEIENEEESEITLDLWGNIIFRLPWHKQTEGTRATVYGNNMFDIMQYIGLKDQNGVEIYEGDYLSLIVFEANKEYKGEVVFSKGSFCVVVQIKGHEYTVPFHEMSEVDTLLEVLGNVYENPELLEVTE